jgi:hypothetical protein
MPHPIPLIIPYKHINKYKFVVKLANNIPVHEINPPVTMTNFGFHPL